MVNTPRFKIGDHVHCKRKEEGSTMGFDFKGVILSVWLGDDWEYEITNAPFLFGPLGPRCLVWDHEILGHVQH
jgi:hypothetical protein